MNPPPTLLTQRLQITKKPPGCAQPARGLKSPGPASSLRPLRGQHGLRPGPGDSLWAEGREGALELKSLGIGGR